MNGESVVWLAFDQQNSNPYWAEIEHHHNFSRRRLYALLEECGFAPRVCGQRPLSRMHGGHCGTAAGDFVRSSTKPHRNRGLRIPEHLERALARGAASDSAGIFR
jgi:hypothetical protein